MASDMDHLIETMGKACDELFEGGGGLEMMGLMLNTSPTLSQEEVSDVSEWAPASTRAPLATAS